MGKHRGMPLQKIHTINCMLYGTSTNIYSLLNRKQLHIFSIKPKLDIRLFVYFCVFPRFSLNVPELNLKLFWTAEKNNFRFSSGKFREKWGKTQKSTNNLMSIFGLLEKIWSCLIFIKLYRTWEISAISSFFFLNLNCNIKQQKLSIEYLVLYFEMYG